jgi:hypothetical protein
MWGTPHCCFSPACLLVLHVCYKLPKDQDHDVLFCKTQQKTLASDSSCTKVLREQTPPLFHSLSSSRQPHKLKWVHGRDVEVFGRV